MNKPSREWATFLRIPDANRTDKVPALDPEWCASRGVYTSAEPLLHLLRSRVLPMIRALEGKKRRLAALRGYHFLVHDRASGVPTTEDDRSAYIHMRLSFASPVQFDKWVDGWNLANRIVAGEHGFVMTRPAGRTEEIGGVDLGLIKNRSVRAAREIIDAQSRWVLDFIEAHDWGDDAKMIQQVRQYLHYFANMLQVRVVG